MQGLPPEARAALNVMSQMQQRPPEDVLRDEIKNYIEGRLPRIDIEGAIKALQARSYQAGYIVGSLRRCTSHKLLGVSDSGNNSRTENEFQYYIKR